MSEQENPFKKWNVAGHVEKWFSKKDDKILYLMYSIVNFRNDLYKILCLTGARVKHIRYN